MSAPLRALKHRGLLTMSLTALWTTDRAVLIPAVIISGIFIGVNNTITTQAVMTVSPVEKPVASAAYGFVRFIGGGLAPYAAGRLVLAVNIHFPFYIGVGAIIGGIVILSTAHGLLTQAERTQAEQVAAATAPAGTEPAEAVLAEAAVAEATPTDAARTEAVLDEAGPAAALIPVEGNAELAGPGASVIVAAVDNSPAAALVTEAAAVLAAGRRRRLRHGGPGRVAATPAG